MKSVILCKSVRNVCLNPGVRGGGGGEVLEPGGFSRGVERVKVSERGCRGVNSISYCKFLNFLVIYSKNSKLTNGIKSHILGRSQYSFGLIQNIQDVNTAEVFG